MHLNLEEHLKVPDNKLFKSKNVCVSSLLANSLETLKKHTFAILDSMLNLNHAQCFGPTKSNKASLLNRGAVNTKLNMFFFFWRSGFRVFNT